VHPDGFCHVEPMLASTVFGATPTEQVKPSSASRPCVMARAMVRRWPWWSYGGATSRPLPAVLNALMMLTSTP
jgi:hypothetical protein